MTYRPINHPAVSAVECPVCHQAAGSPCKAARQLRHGPMDNVDRHYVQTHMGRVKAYEETFNKPESTDQQVSA